MDTQRSQTPDHNPDSAPPLASSAEETAANPHDHDDQRVDEWEAESFPASDPPSNWAGPDTPPA